MNLLLTDALDWTEEQIFEFKKMGFDEAIPFPDERKSLHFDPAIFDAVVCNGLFLYHNIAEFTSLKFIQLTSAGLDRVFVDLEINGKLEGQKNLDTVIWRHSLDDVAKLRAVLTTTQLLTRANPIFDGSQAEIDAVVAAGGDLIIMLPMFKSKTEVEPFSRLVAGRAKTVCLIETKEAVDRLDEILTVPEIDEYYVGLNDLHFSYGLTFMFELLANGDATCAKPRAAGKPFGFSGIARINQGLLSANYILSEHYRLGSSAAILARAFCNCAEIEDAAELDRVFKNELGKFRQYENFLLRRDASFFEDSRELLRDGVAEVKRAIEWSPPKKK